MNDNDVYVMTMKVLILVAVTAFDMAAIGAAIWIWVLIVEMIT